MARMIPQTPLIFDGIQNIYFVKNKKKIFLDQICFVHGLSCFPLFNYISYISYFPRFGKT